MWKRAHRMCIQMHFIQWIKIGKKTHFGEVLWATFLSEHEEKFVIPRKENQLFIFLVPSKLIQYSLKS